MQNKNYKFRILTKWCMAPLGLALLGYFFVGPRIGKEHSSPSDLVAENPAPAPEVADKFEEPAPSLNSSKKSADNSELSNLEPEVEVSVNKQPKPIQKESDTPVESEPAAESEVEASPASESKVTSQSERKSAPVEVTRTKSSEKKNARTIRKKSDSRKEPADLNESENSEPMKEKQKEPKKAKRAAVEPDYDDDDAASSFGGAGQ